MPQGDQAEIKCPYCGTTVIVPPELRPVDSASIQTVNPINIVMNDSGTSIQLTDLSAFQTAPMNIAVPSATARWVKIGIWSFVVLMVVTFVVPFACSMCGIFGGFAGAVVPFFVK